jgi:hypothetical protein
MDHFAFISYAQGKILAGMELSLGAFTSGLAAYPRHGDQTADEQGLFVEEFGQAGTDLAFLCRKVPTVAHNNLHLPDIYKYIR